ncbi:MAG: choice-of-anchor Q domain-containing protein [Marinicella sp.]
MKNLGSKWFNRRKWTYLFISLRVCAVQAIVIDVTRFDDPIPDGCQVNDCSLREAIAIANATSGLDEIILSNGVYEIDIAPAGNNDNDSGDFNVTDALVIKGNGAWLSTINANQIDRLFDVQSATMSLSSIKLVGGFSLTGPGGAINANKGGIILDRVVVENNFSSSHSGGVYVEGEPNNNFADINITRSIFKENIALTYGGALGCWFCNLNIEDSSFIYNNSQGATFSTSQSLNRIVRSGFQLNTSANGAIKFFDSYEFEMQNSTLSHHINTNPSLIGLFEKFGLNDDITLKNNTFVANSNANETNSYHVFIVGGNNDISGNIFDVKMTPINSSGYNIFRADSPPNNTLGSDALINASSELDLQPLKKNGGIAMSHMLGDDSLAIEFREEECNDVDQRGIAKNNPYCDVGAVQSGFCSEPNLPIIDSNPNGVASEIIIGESTNEITSLELYIDVEHPRVGDLRVELEHLESFTQTLLIDQPNNGTCSGNDLDIILSEMNQPEYYIQTSCYSGNGSAYNQIVKKYAPIKGSLNAFNNKNLGGTWKLKVIDLNPNNSGNFNKWCLYPKTNYTDVIYLNGFDS